MELRGSEIPKPGPLRIVKRGQTVTGCPSPGALVDGGRNLSSHSDEGRGGSPPTGADRPLTVRKTRESRGSVLNGSLVESPADLSPGSAILNLIERNSHNRVQQNDPDATPKANRPTGMPITPEQNAHISESSPGQHPVRYKEDTPTPGDHGRIVSRSKNFFLKAIPGRNYSSSLAQKAIRRISANVSKHVKRPPRVGHDCSSFYGGRGSLTLSAMSCSDCEDIADAGTNSAISFHAGSQTTPQLPTLDSVCTMSFRGSFVLCPQINVTPELSVIDTSSCSVWIALEVTGVLHRADGSEEYGNGADRQLSLSSTQPSDLKFYGRLHSMRLDLLPGRDCMISEIFGNLRDLKTLGAKETYLVLVKVRLGGITSSQENTKDAAGPEDLIAGLESDLSNITMPYLKVRVTYKHSGFLDYIPASSPTETGMSTFSTRMQSEATAVIQRTNLQSQWSPSASRTMGGPANINPLIKLIETHFPVDGARSALRRLANDRVQIPPARRPRKSNVPASPSEESVNSYHISSLAARLDSVAAVPLILGSISFDGATDRLAKGNFTDAEHDRDPARKIWTEIRRTSRGGNDRSSTSYSFREEDPDGSPMRTSAAVAVDDERSRIKETAVKNKRSLGADSLRSIAPSVTSMDTKPASSSTSLGLSMTSSWGWGGSWW